MNAMTFWRTADYWDGRLLRANGYLYLCDWSQPMDLGPEFFPDSPEILVSWVNPDGTTELVGALSEDGIFDVVWATDEHGDLVVGVIDIASWDEIEILEIEEELL